MTSSVRAVVLGLDYQARYFWIEACRLFYEQSVVERVSIERPDLKAFDDVVTRYRVPILDAHGRLIEGDHLKSPTSSADAEPASLPPARPELGSSSHRTRPSGGWSAMHVFGRTSPRSTPPAISASSRASSCASSAGQAGLLWPRRSDYPRSMAAISRTSTRAIASPSATRHPKRSRIPTREKAARKGKDGSGQDRSHRRACDREPPSGPRISRRQSRREPRTSCSGGVGRAPDNLG